MTTLRILRVVCATAALVVATAAAAHAATTLRTTVEGESLHRAGGAAVRRDRSASGGRALVLVPGASAWLTTKTAAERVAVRVRREGAGRSPRLTLRWQGRAVLSRRIRSRRWRTLSAALPAPAAVRPRLTAAGSSVRVDWIRLVATPPAPAPAPAPAATPAPSSPPSAAPAPTPTPTSTPAATPTPAPTPAPAPAQANPLAGATLWIDPGSNARTTADAWLASRPADAAALERIAAAPQFDWFGDWSGDVASAVDAQVSQIAAAGGLPLLVAYDIPLRDCDASSGAPSAAAYASWIRAFAAGIGARPAVVVLEPDALAMLDCLTPDQQAERTAALRDAVGVLAALPQVTLYVDAGHSGWTTPAGMAARLADADVDRARGFATNVSNYQDLTAEVAYAKDLAARIGGKHAIIDTSRNGNGPGDTWCNAAGRALGVAPTTATADPSIDAYLWVKRPGESDGTCNGGPPTGTWWPDYALALATAAP